MSHASVPLGEVAELIRGITYKPTDVCTASDDSAVACMRTKNVQESLDQSDIVWIPDSLVRRNAKYLKEGDILVSSANSWNLVGKACWVPRLAYGATAGGFISILRADTQKVDQRYLYHWLTSKSIQAKLRSCSNKTTNISNLDHARTLATEIPLPPLEEQRRIAAILDRISHLLMRAKDASTLNDQLQEAIFNYSFGEFEQAAAKYPTLKLEDVCSQITDGEHQTPLRSESGVKLLSARNIRNGKLDFSDVDYVPMEEFLRIGRRCAPVRGDVLISCSGSIGRVAVVDTDEPLAMVRSAAMARPVQAKVRPFFLETLLRTRCLQQCMRRSANASSQANLFQGKIRALPVFLPSLEEQDKFVARVSKVRASAHSLSSRIFELQALIKSTKNMVFSGEIEP